MVAGEGEVQLILQILDDVEEGIEHEESFQDHETVNTERINTNGMPTPDYTGLDFNEYKVTNGAIQKSRGCTAKCTCCEETHFWKYRQRKRLMLLQKQNGCTTTKVHRVVY